MSDEQALTVVGDTGLEIIESHESIQRSALEHLISPLRETSLPIHEQVLQGIGDCTLQEKVANAYYGSEPLSFKLFAGKKKKVLGMMLYEQGPYLENVKPPAIPREMPGFFRILILLEEKDEEGRYKLVKSGSTRLAMHVWRILQARRWFLFVEPREYIFSQGSNNAHFLYDITDTLDEGTTI